MAACSAELSQLEVQKNLVLQGEMLFEGPNTLSMANDVDLISLIEGDGLNTEQVESVGIKQAQITFDTGNEKIAESVLLQVVSDNNELITIGTLSPLPASTMMSLKLADEIDLKPYLMDNGCTWVLDVNLNGDKDAMAVKAKLNLIVNYKEN